MKYIKNRLRNKLGNDFLDDLMIGFLEQDIVNKVIKDSELQEQVINKFRDLGDGSNNHSTSRKRYI